MMQGLQRRTYTEDEARVLEEQWQEAVRTKTFSPGVVGVGEFRLFGRSGDTPGTYPQVRDLTSLTTLSPAELYALQMIDEAAEASQRQHQALVAVTPGMAPGPECRLESFDATKACIYAISRVIGG
jgi:hypothetical protein